MRILYLTNQTYLHGGIEKVLSQKANYFAGQLGADVYIVTHNQQGNLPVYPISSNIQLQDLGINYIDGVSYFHPKNLLKIRQHKKALKKTIREIRPDVIISCSFGPDFYFIPALEKHLPKIKEFHSSRYYYAKNPNTLKDKILGELTKKAEQKYDQLVVLNNSEEQFYHNRNIAVIPNPTEISAKRAMVTSKKILAAGRISPVKNFGELIEIFAKVAQDFPDWELHFFGEDYLGTQAILEQKIKVFSLEEQVKFRGITSDLKGEMEQYSIYAMTSETECFPMVLLEALSVGLPVISYDSPTGPKHILRNNEDSFLVPYKEPEDLDPLYLDIFANQLTQLMENQNLRQEMGLKGSKNAQRFNVDTVMLQWKNLINRLSRKNS